MLNNINKTDLFYDYYAQWITVYKEGAIRKVTREASFYTGISEKKLIEITNLYACPFVLWMGNRRFIKRKAFEKFIQTSEFKGGADDEQIE